MKRVNIHLGAHKTATTSFQAVLRKNRGLLSAENVFYFPREEFRDAVTRPYFYPKNLGCRDGVTFLDVLEESDLYSGEDNIVISEENLIALVQEVFVDDAFYPYSLERMKELRSFFLGVDVAGVFFTVRDYSEFIPSVYTQINKSLPFSEFSVFRDRFRSYGFSWVDIVRSIHNVFPEAELYVARFEDMIRSPGGYYSKIIFDVPYESLAGLDAKLNEGVSSEVVRFAEFAKKELSVRLSGKQFSDLSRLYPASKYSKYEPFGDEESKVLIRKYLNDIKRIESLYGVFV